MVTATEAMEQAAAKEKEAQKPAEGAEGTKPATSEEGAAAPAPSFAEGQKQVEEIEAAAAAGDIEVLRKQNRELTVKQFPEEMRQGVGSVFDLHAEAGYVQRERKALDAEKVGMTRDRILKEYQEAGVTEAHLKHCPDEAAMKEMAESIKALKGEGEGEGGKGGEGGKPAANPGAMNEKPSSSTAGAAGGAKPAAEQFKRAGVEAGVTGLLGGWQRGEE